MRSPGAALRRINVAGWLTVVALGGLWEASVRSGMVDYQYFPAPSEIASAGRVLLSSGELGTAVVHTAVAALAGWLVAAVVGIALGLLLGLSATAWRYSMASIEAMKAVPPITLVPVALLLFGFSVPMELVIIVYVALWPVLINTIGGVRGVDDELRDVARMLRMSRMETVRKIVVPAAMPSIAVGVRLALSLALVLAVVAEMVGNPRGLGNALVRAQQALRPAEMFAYVLAIGLLGVALNAIFRSVSTWAAPGIVGHRPGEGP